MGHDVRGAAQRIYYMMIVKFMRPVILNTSLNPSDLVSQLSPIFSSATICAPTCLFVCFSCYQDVLCFSYLGSWTFMIVPKPRPPASVTCVLQFFQGCSLFPLPWTLDLHVSYYDQAEITYFCFLCAIVFFSKDVLYFSCLGHQIFLSHIVTKPRSPISVACVLELFPGCSLFLLLWTLVRPSCLIL